MPVSGVFWFRVPPRRISRYGCPRVRGGEIPLSEVQVRLVRPDEVSRWNDLLRAHQCLKLCS